jgi:adenine-specific DNA-methyltransferase
MLAQLENFQKRLWLKKKFVVQCDYCITLDRVPEKLYQHICDNEAQRKEWVRLFAINDIKGDMMTEGYSEPLTIEFLKQNPFLVLDTAFFDTQFKHKLIASMENVDEQTNGLLINSENFQALELLQEKYRKRINGIYIDPPYNTSASEIVYKNSYKKSSWASMIIDRINEGKKLLTADGLSCITIDDFMDSRTLRKDNNISNNIINLMINLKKINPDFLDYNIYSNIERFLCHNDKKSVIIQFKS